MKPQNQVSKNLKPVPSLCQTTMSASSVSQRILRDRLFFRQNSFPTHISDYETFAKRRPVFGVLGAILATFVLFSTPRTSFALNAINAEILADAIYLAEGGSKTKYPYGIISVKCSGETECRKICLNTIRNNHKRWLNSDKSLTYLEFLASRYAPIGVSNDPTNLNKHWLGNVQAIYERLTHVKRA